MDTLPTELHMEILAFCCDTSPVSSNDNQGLTSSATIHATSSSTPSPADNAPYKTDAGATVRALSSVSRYFAAIARPWLYQTVCVRGVRQAERLLSRLEGGQEAGAKGVRHMFLQIDDTSNTSITAYNNFSSVQHHKNPRLSPAEQHTLTRLVLLSSPTLYTLSFSFSPSSPGYASSPTLIARLFRMRFPLLLSLSVAGYYPFPGTPGTFPRLKTLTLDGNRSPVGLLSMRGLGEACAVLERLEVRGLMECGDGREGAFLSEVREAIGAANRRRDERGEYLSAYDGEELGDHGDGDEMFAPRLPPRVRCVVLQAGPDPTRAACNSTTTINTPATSSAPSVSSSPPSSKATTTSSTDLADFNQASADHHKYRHQDDDCDDAATCKHSHSDSDAGRGRGGVRLHILPRAQRVTSGEDARRAWLEEGAGY